jgi:hypothetical protein
MAADRLSRECETPHEPQGRFLLGELKRMTAEQDVVQEIDVVKL